MTMMFKWIAEAPATVKEFGLWVGAGATVLAGWALGVMEKRRNARINKMDDRISHMEAHKADHDDITKAVESLREQYKQTTRQLEETNQRLNDITLLLLGERNGTGSDRTTGGSNRGTEQSD